MGQTGPKLKLYIECIDEVQLMIIEINMFLTDWRFAIPSPVDVVTWAGTGLAVTLGVGLGFGVGKRSAKKKRPEMLCKIEFSCQ